MNPEKKRRVLLRRSRAIQPPEPGDALHLIRSDHFSRVVDYTIKLALLGSCMPVAFLPVKRSMPFCRRIGKGQGNRIFIPDERELNLKDIGKPTQGLSPPGSFLFFQHHTNKYISLHNKIFEQ